MEKVKDNMSSDSFMELCDAPLPSFPDLFPCLPLDKAVEKSSHVLHNKAIHKVASLENPNKRPN